MLLRLSLRYNLSAHGANLPNLLAGALGMIVNNTIFFIGMWGMLFASKPENAGLVAYYIAVQALLLTSWGAINFFFGGWIDLGELIINGQFESKLATPRHALLLVGIHASHPSALGDLLMGLASIVGIAFLGSPAMALRIALACILVTIAWFSLYIFSGSIAFFVARGNVLATLVREVTLSLSSYPIGKMFPSGLGRIALLLTPAAAVSVLPLEWIETAGWREFGVMLFGLGLLLGLSLAFYRMGVKRFQTISLTGIS